MRKTYILLLSAIIPAIANAGHYDDIDGDDVNYKGLAGLSLGLNSHGYELDFNASYWPVMSFGFKIAIGCAGEIEEIEDWDWLNDDYDDSSDDYTVRFKVMPSIELKSPSLLSSESEASLHIFGNPGICLSPGASGSRDAQWFNWQLRCGIELDIDCLAIQLGYGYSNFYLYSGYPISHHGYDDNPYHKTHSGFVGVGVRF